MDFKINLPTEECTCEAKVFYDKYRKQVDAFIENELEIAKTSDVVVGRKALTEAGSSIFDYEQAGVLSKQSRKRKGHLPKIKGAKYKGTKKGESESISVSTVTTETHLPEIKITKKWSDELSSSSSSDIMLLIDEGKKKKAKSWQEEIRELQLKDKKEAEDEVSSSSSEITQLKDKSKQKKTKPWQAKTDKKEAEYELPSSSSEIMQLMNKQKETGEFQLKQKKKSEDELSSSSLEIMQLVDRSKQKEIKQQQKKIKSQRKETDKSQLQEKKESEDELSSSSSEIMQLVDRGKQKEIKPKQKETTELQLKEKKKTEDEVSSSSSEIMQLVDEGKQKKTKLQRKEIDDLKYKDKKKVEDELSFSSPEIMQQVDESKQIKIKKLRKKTDELRIKKKEKAEDDLSSSSSERKQKEIERWQEEKHKLQFKKKKKTDFLSILISKSKKEGLDDDFIANMLNKAREAGQEQDLLFYLSNANDEGTLDSLLFTMSEAMKQGKFEEFTTNIVNEGKEKKRKSLLSKLINVFKSDKTNVNYMASLIAEAVEKDPDDELFLILSKAVKKNDLNSLISNINQARKQGQLDDMVSILLIKGKKEQTKRLLSLVNTIAREKGTNDNFVEELLSKAKKSGELDELLSEFMKAKTKGSLDEYISTLIDATDENTNNYLVSKPEEKKQDEKDFTHLLLEDVFDDDFLAKWFARVKTNKEEKLLLKKLTEVMRSGKYVEFNTLAKEKSLENIEELFAIFDEVISTDDSDIDITISREKKQKILRPRLKQFKKVQKYKKRKVTIVEENVEDTGSAVMLLQKQNRKLSKIKRQILYKRKYSVGNTLPDIDYDLIERHKLKYINLTEPEKSDEEEHVYEQKIEKKKSRIYRESFLKKIYGGRAIRPASDSSSSVDSSVTSVNKYVVRKRLPKKKSRVIVTAKEQPPPPSPRKMKKHVVKYAKKKPLRTAREFSDDSDVSSFEDLLDKKISRMCDISGEERSERGYLVGFRYKDDDETFDWRKKPKKSSTFSESYHSGEWISKARRRAIIYFNTRKIEDLFHFLGSHLVSDKPDNPIDYLIILLGECLHFRNGIGRPPLLFEHYHVESLYYSMDIFHEGFISLEQYRTGLETLLIKEFEQNPRRNKKNMVLKETFLFEALKRQRIDLRTMLRGSSAIFSSKENSSTTLGSVWSKIELYHEG